MKIRAIKTRLIRTARVLRTKQVATLPTASLIRTLYPVFRKKDNVQVATVSSIAEAEALVLKAKAAKKASLYIGTAIV